MHVTSTGISLTPEQWAAVKGSAAAVSEALDAEEEDFTVDLSAQRKLRVRLVGKNLCVDVREFYEKDGEDAPGKKGVIIFPCLLLCLSHFCQSSGVCGASKICRLNGQCVWAGISLPAVQWEALVSATGDIDAELQALGASANHKPKESAGAHLLPILLSAGLCD